MSEIDPRKNAWLEHKATRECLDGLGAVPPCELDFQRGWNAHASHTAAIREKAEALVAKHIEVCEADVFEMNFGDGTMMIGMSPKDIYQIGYAAALFGLGPELTALKAALEGKQ